MNCLKQHSSENIFLVRDYVVSFHESVEYLKILEQILQSRLRYGTASVALPAAHHLKLHSLHTGAFSSKKGKSKTRKVPVI